MHTIAYTNNHFHSMPQKIAKQTSIFTEFMGSNKP
jgi:hypothetical protein